MKQGFTLLEILVALGIASVIITMLFNSYFQTINIISRADNVISINTRAVLVKHQLEKDIMGAFLPVQAMPEKEEKGLEKKALDQKQTQTQEAQPPSKKEPEKNERKQLAKVFYGINRGGVLDILTFITNNPMSIYWGGKTGKAKPKVVRIVYRLVEDKDQKGSFTLLRQEGTDLEFESYASGEGSKGIRAYPLAERVKELSVKYRVLLEPEEKKDQKKEEQQPAQQPEKQPEPAPQKQKEKKKKEIKFQLLDQWDMEKELPKDVKRRIPNIVDVKVAFWDDQRKRDVSFEFSIPILPDIIQQPEKKQKPVDKQDKDKKQQTDMQATPLSSPVPQRGGLMQRGFNSTSVMPHGGTGQPEPQNIVQHHVQTQDQDVRSQILRLLHQGKGQS